MQFTILYFLTFILFYFPVTVFSALFLSLFNYYIFFTVPCLSFVSPLFTCPLLHFLPLFPIRLAPLSPYQHGCRQAPPLALLFGAKLRLAPSLAARLLPQSNQRIALPPLFTPAPHNYTVLRVIRSFISLALTVILATF